MTSDDEMMGSENVSSQIRIELFRVGRTGASKIKAAQNVLKHILVLESDDFKCR